MATTSRWLWIVSGLLVTTGIVWSGLRVALHEQGELAFTSERKALQVAARDKEATRLTARIASVELRAGDHAVFEICTDDGLHAEQWLDAPGFAVFQLKPLKLLLRTPLDQAHLAVVKRKGSDACLALGGGRIEQSGRVAVDAILPATGVAKPLADTALWLRVLARRPLQLSDRLPILLIASGALLLVLGLFKTRARTEAASFHADTLATSGLVLGAGLLIVISGWLLSAYVGPSGPTWGFIKTVALASVEVIAAVLLVRWGFSPRSTTDLLSLHAPERSPWLALCVAPICGLLLVGSAILCIRLLPPTGESAIETFISWPSGMLAFGAIGALVPLCEEVFFRGFVYARALAFGKFGAFVITAASFIALHAAQTWGNWGSLLSIAITGVVLTGLRAATGSTLIPALAHLVYNLSLTLRSF